MEDLLKLKVSELRKKCKDLGLSITGNKTELITRIQEQVSKSGDDSVLNEAELLGELDGSDSQVVSNVDEDLLLGDSVGESKSNNETLTKSNVDVSEHRISEEIKEPPSKIQIIENDSTKENVITKVTVLSNEQKKQERAARFGINNPDTSDEKKIARAKRFGLDIPKSNGNSSVDIEKLKQREARFGVSVSNKLQKVADDEKKQKRAERFGIQDQSKEKPDNSNIDEDKKLLRAKRFGLNIDSEKKAARAAKFGK